MSTEPENWTTPKTDFSSESEDGFLDSDINAINTNIDAIENGSRTLNPTYSPVDNVGNLRLFLDYFASQIGKILGKPWYSDVKTNLKDSFWVDGAILSGSVISGPLLDSSIFASAYCKLPPGKVLMLTKLKYHAGPDVESSEHRYFIRAAYVTPSEGGLFKTYEITRPEASGDPPVTPPYQNDIDLQEQFAINTGESDKHITIRFLCGGGVEPITLGSMDDYQLKARFDIFDISEL